MVQETAIPPFMTAFRGSFTSALRWHHLDTLWQVLRAAPDDWFIYAVGETPPKSLASSDDFLYFIDEIDLLLRKEHDEDYCGIVYADDLKQPSMVKIFDPNNLGVSCGYSDNPPPPGWILSKIPPVDLQANQILPNNRKRWWQKILSK